MLRFRKLENFLSLFVSAYLYVILLQIGFRPESVGNRVRSKSTVSISSTFIFISPSMEIVPHSQRELVVYKGNLTSYHFIFSFKASFTKLLNDFFASIFRYRRYNRSRILVVM